MKSSKKNERLGLELFVQRPDAEDAKRIPVTPYGTACPIYPELDADGDHVHFEMVPMGGDSLLWLTIRRGISPQIAAASLRKIANLLDRHGLDVLNLTEGSEGSVSAAGDVISGPLRLDYDENGDLIIPHEPSSEWGKWQ